ncbi:MAG: tripartite motif-containing protein 71 [Thermoleophilaceae bacterium]|nr:tripartite motif-containing protein 71 [Thermoleophilaceae bacterium]
MRLRRTSLLIALGAALACAAPAGAAAGGLRFAGAWGSHGVAEGQFLLPDGIAVDSGGNVWVADRNRNRIERFTSAGRFRPFPAFRSRHRSAAPGRLNLPYDVAVDRAGRIYVADTHNDRIQEFSRKGRLIRRWGSHGTAAGQFDQPRAVALDPFGNVWVADHENKRVQKFTAGGRFLGRFGAHAGDGTAGSGEGEFNSPRGLSSDAQGDIYVADDANNRIVKLGNDGGFLMQWGRRGAGDGELKLPYSTAVDAAGNVWVTDTNNNRLQEFTADGTFVARFGANGGDTTPGAGPGEFDHPYDLAFDRAGNLYVTDEGNQRVEKFATR